MVHYSSEHAASFGFHARDQGDTLVYPRAGVRLGCTRQPRFIDFALLCSSFMTVVIYPSANYVHSIYTRYSLLSPRETKGLKYPCCHLAFFPKLPLYTVYTTVLKIFGFSW